MNHFQITLDKLALWAKQPSLTVREKHKLLFPTTPGFHVLQVAFADVDHLTHDQHLLKARLRTFLTVMRKDRVNVICCWAKLGTLPGVSLHRVEYANDAVGDGAGTDACFPSRELSIFIEQARENMHLLRQSLAGQYAPKELHSNPQYIADEEAALSLTV